MDHKMWNIIITTIFQNQNMIHMKKNDHIGQSGQDGKMECVQEPVEKEAWINSEEDNAVMVLMLVWDMAMSQDNHLAIHILVQLTDTGQHTLNGGKNHHAQEAVEADRDTWHAIVNAKAHMVEDVLVLEAAKKWRAYPVTLNLAQSMGFGDHGSNSLVVSPAE